MAKCLDQDDVKHYGVKQCLIAVIAEAAETTRERVLVTAIHQHDTPLADLEAQRILDGSRLRGAIIDPTYHERCVQTTAAALREGLKHARRVTHFGTGQAQVDRVASSRRYLGPGGEPKFDRSSMSGADTVSEQRSPRILFRLPNGHGCPFTSTRKWK